MTKKKLMTAYKPELNIDNKPLVDRPIGKWAREAQYNYFHGRQDVEAYKKAFGIK